MKFTPRSESTRQLIIESAAEVFNKKGFTGTSITDLEKATGLTKGSIYGNFENKDAVAIAVFEYNLKIKFDYIQLKENDCNSFKERLLTHVLVHFPSAKAPFTPGGCPMQNTAVEAAYTNVELKRLAGAGLLRWTGILNDLIIAGIDAHEFKKTTDAIGTALQIISLIEGGALYAKSTDNTKYAIKLLGAAKQVIESICN